MKLYLLSIPLQMIKKTISKYLQDKSLNVFINIIHIMNITVCLIQIRIYLLID